jgi:uncharacterized protein (DUF2062 family)
MSLDERESLRPARGEPISRGRELFGRHIAQPLAGQLRRGVTPTRLAWSIALGMCLSLLPVPGTTTALCAIAAYALGLNPVAIQVANFAAAPIQLALFLPFIQLGQRLFRGPPLPLTQIDLNVALSLGAASFMGRFGIALLQAVVIWALCAVPLALLLQLALRPLLVRALRKLDLAQANGAVK